MSVESDPDEVFELLGDEYVRTILRASSEKRQSAKDLSEACDSALSTVYRRVDALEDHHLLLEGTELEVDGSHHSVYEAGFTELTVTLEDGEFALEFALVRETHERFTTMWEDMRDI